MASEITQSPVKPGVAVVVQVAAALVVASCGADLGATAIGAPGLSLSAITGTLVLSVLVIAVSLRVLVGLGSLPFRRRRPVSLYLWGMLLLYPFTTALRGYDAFLPAPYYADDELLGAAVAELARYLWYLFLIVWVALSKRLKLYLEAAQA